MFPTLPFIFPNNSKLRVTYLLFLCVLIGVVAYIFSPLLVMFPQSVAVSSYPDFLEFVWTSWRLEKVLGGTESLYFTKLIFAPTGASLLLHTISEGVLLPVSMVFHQVSPVWRVNLSFLLLIAVNIISLFSLIRGIKVGSLLTFLFSLLIGVGPFLMGHVHAGHINFLILFPLIEAIHGLHTILFSGRDTISKAPLLRYVFAVLVLPFCNLYYLYFFGLIGIFYVISYVWIELRSQNEPANDQGSVSGTSRTILYPLRRLCTLVLLTLLGCAPAIPHLYDIAALALSRSFTPDHNPVAHSATLSDFLLPSRLQEIYKAWSIFLPMSVPRLHVGESALYVPYSIIVLSVYFSLWRSGYCAGHRKNLILSLLFFSVSFGPKITIFDSIIVSNPLDWFFRTLLPLFPSVPARFGGLGSLFLILFVAGCTIQATKRELRFLVAPLLLLGCIEILPVPVEPHRLQDYTALKELIESTSSSGIIVDLSVSAQNAMYRQTFHGRAIVGGFLSRRPKQMERKLRRNVFVRFMRGESIHSSEEVIRAWCELEGELLLVDIAANYDDLYTRLRGLGFNLLGKADDIAVFRLVDSDCVAP